MIKIGSKVKAKDGFVGYVIYKTNSNLFSVVKNKEDLRENPWTIFNKYRFGSDQWGAYDLQELTKVNDEADKTDTIVKVALIIQLVAIVVVAFTIVTLTIQTQIENDKKFDRLLENQFILEERLEYLETGR